VYPEAWEKKVGVKLRAIGVIEEAAQDRDRQPAAVARVRAEEGVTS
jgi:hypothetical protein